jgi:hypothetical protein
VDVHGVSGAVLHERGGVLHEEIGRLVVKKERVAIERDLFHRNSSTLGRVWADR